MFQPRLRYGHPMSRLLAGPIDLYRPGEQPGYCCYLLETSDGLALFDCGSSSTFPSLEQGLADHGVGFADLRHVLLSHIHLDHAGAAGLVVERNPEVAVHVSGIGAPHVVEPGRLEASARRIYGETFDHLWGTVVPVPQANVRTVGARVLDLDVFPTPGHAGHHVSYLDTEGTLYSGDVAGVRLPGGTFVLPPTPPPDVDVEAWERSTAASLARDPSRLALVHLDVFDDVSSHYERLHETLGRWSQLVEQGMSGEEFTALVRAEIAEAEATSGLAPWYETAVTLDSCHAGLERYWRTKRETA